MSTEISDSEYDAFEAWAAAGDFNSIINFIENIEIDKIDDAIKSAFHIIGTHKSFEAAGAVFEIYNFSQKDKPRSEYNSPAVSALNIIGTEHSRTYLALLLRKIAPWDLYTTQTAIQYSLTSNHDVETLKLILPFHYESKNLTRFVFEALERIGNSEAIEALRHISLLGNDDTDHATLKSLYYSSQMAALSSLIKIHETKADKLEFRDKIVLENYISQMAVDIANPSRLIDKFQSAKIRDTHEDKIIKDLLIKASENSRWVNGIESSVDTARNYVDGVLAYEARQSFVNRRTGYAPS